jgi:FAD/FMN-containing dehydrogenase
MPSDPLVIRLAAALGADRVTTDPDRLGPLLRDERGRFEGKARCLVQPRTTAEVAATVRICAEAGVAMVPQGGNSGLCAGATPFERGDEVLVSLTRLNRLRAVEPDNFTLTAEAGMTLQAVQQAAAAVDRLFPLSLGAEGTCQIGGNISTNAGGIHVLRYGTMRDLVLGLEAVLPSGEVWDGLKSLRKDNTGYDLKQLFIGAEGTLGIVTAASLKLFPRPRAQAVALVALQQPEHAIRLLSLARAESGDRVTAIELMGWQALAFAYRHVPGLARPLAGEPPWTLILELSAGAADEAIAERLESILAQALEQGLASDAVVAQNEQQAASFWKLRESIVWAQRPEGASLKHDIAVPVAAVPAFLAQALPLVARLVPGIRPVPFGHVGDGNLHFNLTKPEGMADAAFLAAGERVHQAVHDLVRGLGGSISAEHGIGRIKVAENARTKPPLDIALQRAIKRALDPRNLMNPGKVVAL